ncbi:MAG: ice-binding family protein [Patescibacteria group bacterium]
MLVTSFGKLGSSATLGTGTTFAGNILALTSITDNGGSTVNGRLLARNGAVTLNNTTVTVPTCTTTPDSGSSGYTGTISVVKIVINDNGGTQEIEDFPLFINDTQVLSGATTSLPANPSQYFVSETSNANYTQAFTGDCDEFGFMNLRGAQHLLCVLTNDDIGTPIIIPPVPPIIEVVKVPSPLALPDGPGTVTYTYSLYNIGTVPVTDIVMTDNTCVPTYVSGDSDSDTHLDLTETWTYSCTNTLSSTHTNTVVASGWANGLNAIDVATATVVVGEAIVPPLIHVTKIPNPLTLLAGGGLVTYTETITNPGTETLSNVTISDNKCSPVTYVSGDTNDNGLLESDESWVHTCSSNITSNTTNTVTVTGEANDMMATDFAVVTVLVAAALPTLPNAGLAPTTGMLVWPIVAASLGVISLVGYLLLKKKRTT